jgi:uncharacterized lipoprotein YddW (UPF0748 family)
MRSEKQSGNTGSAAKKIVLLLSAVLLVSCAKKVVPVNAGDYSGFALEEVRTVTAETKTANEKYSSANVQSAISSPEKTSSVNAQTSTASSENNTSAAVPKTSAPTNTSAVSVPAITTAPVIKTAANGVIAEKPPESPEITEPALTEELLTIASEKPAVTEKTQTAPASDGYTALNYNKVKGIWISYIELSEILTGKTEQQFRTAFAKMLDNCKSVGVNTVYVHVRPFGDALYNSEYFPYSKYVTGKIGVKPAFDPLEIMLELSHSRQISFHAWINPMRVNSAADITSVSSDYAVGKWYRDNSPEIYKEGDYYYLNPAYPDVRNLIAAGTGEIVSKYNVDGIHIDDYFYPTTSTNFDSAAYSSSGYTDLSQFRKDNCTNMVKQMYTAIKSANPTVLFGIAPQGNISNNLTQLYADVNLWAGQKGYCDYVAPQIYYGFQNSAQPFDTCLKQWKKLTSSSGVKLIPGLAVYKIGQEDKWAGTGKSEWITDSSILKKQADLIASENCSGYILYSYNYLFNPSFNTPAINAQAALLQ